MRAAFCRRKSASAFTRAASAAARSGREKVAGGALVASGDTPAVWGLGPPLSEQRARLRQPRLGAFPPGGGEPLPRGVFPADFDELIDRRDRVVAAVPKTVAQRGAAGMTVGVDLLDAER